MLFPISPTKCGFLSLLTAIVLAANVQAAPTATSPLIKPTPAPTGKPLPLVARDGTVTRDSGTDTSALNLQILVFYAKPHFPAIFTLASTFVITTATSTRTYDWTISTATGGI